MIIVKEFIWTKDHYVYHVTSKSNLESIKKYGLLPLNGPRSKSVDDDSVGVFFFDDINFNLEWKRKLYGTSKNIITLRFNLKGKVWHIRNSDIGDFYAEGIVSPEDIRIMKTIDGRRIFKPIIETNYKQKVFRKEK